MKAMGAETLRTDMNGAVTDMDRWAGNEDPNSSADTKYQTQNTKT